MELALTHHSRERLQQRAIPSFVLDLLFAFGSSMRCKGAERLFFDKPARRRLMEFFGRNLKAIERWLGVYAVVGDNGRLVTVAHQQGRYLRP